MASILLVPEHHHQKPSLTHIRWIKKPRYPVHVSGKSLVHTFQKHSLADKEQSQQFHGVFYLPSTVPETLTNLPSKAASSTPSKNTQLWLHKKNLATNTRLYTCAQTHTYAHPTISRSHSWCYHMTLSHYFWFFLSQYINSHLGRKYCAWNDTLGLGANYFSTGESESGWNTKKQLSINAAFRWQNQLCSTWRS